MLYLVEVPVHVLLEVVASSAEAAADLSGEEAKRLLDLAGRNAVEGSPAHCMSAEFVVLGHRRVYPELGRDFLGQLPNDEA